MMKPSSISGVTCNVSDLDASVAFYEAFGFRIGKRDDAHATCYVNWFWVDLVAQDERQAGAATNGTGVYLHIKVGDLEEVLAVARSLGLSPPEPQVRSGNREIVLSDPDGYNLVFFAKK